MGGTMNKQPREHQQHKSKTLLHDHIIENQKHTSRNLPYDIVENILSRLPVKSLLRFKAVCKLWKATISNPDFARFHLQQSRNSACQNPLFLYAYKVLEYRVVKFDNGKVEALSVIKCPYERPWFIVLCDCDGLILRSWGSTYLLCNPSNRTFTALWCPYPFVHDNSKLVHGICYDPLFMDYKVVITNMKHYAVFYCRNRYWTLMKEVNKEVSHVKVFSSKGVSFDGDFYWVLRTQLQGDEEEDQDGRCAFGFEIIHFNSRYDKFKKLPKPPHTEDTSLLDLTCSGDHLFLFHNMYGKSRYQISKMIKDGEEVSWMVFDVLLPSIGFSVMPVCLINEDEIIIDAGDSKYFILYNLRKNTSAEIQKSCSATYYRPVPYLENLAMFFV